MLLNRSSSWKTAKGCIADSRSPADVHGVADCSSPLTHINQEPKLQRFRKDPRLEWWPWRTAGLWGCEEGAQIMAHLKPISMCISPVWAIRLSMIDVSATRSYILLWSCVCWRQLRRFGSNRISLDSVYLFGGISTLSYLNLISKMTFCSVWSLHRSARTAEKAPEWPWRQLVKMKEWRSSSLQHFGVRLRPSSVKETLYIDPVVHPRAVHAWTFPMIGSHLCSYLNEEYEN